MQVRLAVDEPRPVYTNLDFIKGRVLLSVPSMTGNISSVVVKLEGESRTRLLAPPMSASNPRRDQPMPVVETHKILYKVQHVFPPPELAAGSQGQRTYTLSMGNYEYPFQFKVPFNNACTSGGLFRKALNFGPFNLEAATPPTRHVKMTLPPSLTAFPGLAEVRYFLKVTVNRREFYKENPRFHLPFNLLPIEPPRPPKSTLETYARRTHEFVNVPNGSAKPARRKNFRKGTNTSASSEPPSISIDARVPSPSIITCNQPLPLRIIAKRLDDSREPLVLDSLKIELTGYTVVRAQEETRTETSTWVVADISKLGMLLSSPDGNVQGAELVVNDAAWSKKSLPSSVAPSFETCNILRKYELNLRVGVGYGTASSQNAVIFPLSLPVRVYSGIAPPPALLAAMSSTPSTPISTGRRRPNAASAAAAAFNTSKVSSQVPAPAPAPAPSASAFASSSTGPPPRPPRANTSSAAGPSTVAAPAAPAVHIPVLGGEDGEEDPPPSYEDAIAQDLPPVDGPRARYEPPPVPPGAPQFPVEERARRRNS